MAAPAGKLYKLPKQMKKIADESIALHKDEHKLLQEKKKLKKKKSD